MDLKRDYPKLLTMQKQSYQINFPGSELEEIWFRSALEMAKYDGSVTIYESGQALVGWLWLTDVSDEALHIRHIQVNQAYWGRGIGRWLVEQAIAAAREMHKQAVTLNVTKSNLRAMALYHRMGFRTDHDYGERLAMRLELPIEPNTG
ncbi:MAG: GNAT family N-acetyltransferase [Chloroflexi bacterium]|nr:GNAT family N-acetyltransferase [Chloroflexota bacterium]